MPPRLRHGRRFQNCIKYIASALVAIVYFAFLFRQSMNAYEEKKDKANNLNLHTELLPRLKRVLKPQEIKNSLQQHQTPNNQSKETVAVAFDPPTAPTTLNPIYEYSEELHSATEKELKARNAHLQDVCQRYNLQARYPPNTWEFFISPGHNLVWCNVFKAGSSAWLYYFNILGGYHLRFLQRTKQPPLNLARKRFPRPPMYELLESLPNSVSFLFVRDPFERVLSAYRDKFESGRNSYFKPLSMKIIKRYRKHSIDYKKGRAIKIAPTFPEFISYIIDQYAVNKTFDEHWAPVFSFCTPCSVNFTIIGKVETFQRDADYIIRQAGLESLLLGRLPKQKERQLANISDIKTKELLEIYYSQLDRKTFEDLLNIYRLDFELFNYDINKYYNIVMGLTTTKQGSSENTTTTVNFNVKANSSPTYSSNVF